MPCAVQESSIPCDHLIAGQLCLMPPSCPLLLARSIFDANYEAAPSLECPLETSKKPHGRYRRVSNLGLSGAGMSLGRRAEVRPERPLGVGLMASRPGRSGSLRSTGLQSLSLFLFLVLTSPIIRCIRESPLEGTA